jgi:transposase-like protein
VKGGDPVDGTRNIRNAARRLAIIRHAQAVTRNVARTCRYYGVTRESYYKWLRRYEELGVDGLRDRL